MRIDRKTKTLVAKEPNRRIEIVTTVFEPCKRCEGTGLEHHDGETVDCMQCQGYGEIRASKRKEIKHEF